MTISSTWARCTTSPSASPSAFAAKSREDFDADENLRLAIVQLLGWLGEAARRVSVGFRASHAEIPWALVIGMRNVLMHDYMSVDYDVVFKAATANVPALVGALETVLAQGET